MKTSLPNPHYQREQFNTLAQTGTGQMTKPKLKPQIIVKGNGTKINNNKSLLSRAKRKMITQKMILSLIDVSKSKEDPKRAKAYWNTYYCQNKIYSSGGKLYGKYCKNRFCTLCCGIRKAKIINKYLPVIKSWKEPYFVTLTVKSVPASKLKYWIVEGMIRGFKRLVERNKKRNQRGKGKKLIGIKSLECCFNPMAKTYNPHFHIIAPDKETAELLIREWLKLWTKKFALRICQDMRKVEDKEGALMEIIKYGSKIFTEPDVNKKSKQKGNPLIYSAALNNIFLSMKDHRIFDRFGFNLPKSRKIDEKVINILSVYQELNYNPKVFDWENTESEQILSGFEPSSELKSLLDHNIDTETE